MVPGWFWATILGMAIAAGVVVLFVGHVSLRAPAAALALYRRHFPEVRHERLFLASVAFFVTFLIARGMAWAIAAGAGPFRNVRVGTVHVHHLVWGVLALLGVGLCWLAQIGTGGAGGSRPGARLTAIVYGAAAALTLDEFALWLRLEDVYWSPEGRLSVHVVLLFGGVLWVLTSGGRFLHAIARASLMLLGRRD